MRAVLQRVSRAAVTINGGETRAIGRGLAVLLGVHPDDGEKDIDWLVQKISGMRIFTDEAGKMNLSVQDIDGEVLVVSQFTLFATTKKGNRPGFSLSAPPDKAIPLYESFVAKMKERLGKDVPTGDFGAHMDVDIQNQGPVTILLDSQNRE